MQNIYRSFNSFNEFLILAEQDSKASEKSSRSSTSSWNGGVSWTEALQLAKLGWVDGLDKIKDLKNKLDIDLGKYKLSRLPSYGYQGHAIDIGKFLQNDLECFQKFDYFVDEKPGQIYKVVCSISVSAAISTEVIIQKGAITACLIDIIESLGNRVELVVNEKSKDGSYTCEYDILIKKADESLQLIDLAFSLIHPAMLRRLVFSVNEIDGWSDYSSGYGRPIEATDKGDIYISEIFSGKVSNDQAIKWILETLTKNGIQVSIEQK